MLSENYTDITATIWLAKGDHFFFYCDKKVIYAPNPPLGNDTSGFYYAPLRNDVLCSADSMVASYPKTDNVKLTVKSYQCNSQQATLTTRAIKNQAWFSNACI